MTQVPGISKRKLQLLEFHRHAYALMPEKTDPHPGVAVFVDNGPQVSPFRSCTCQTFKKKTCPHLLELSGFINAIRRYSKGKGLYQDFRESLWYRLSAILVEERPLPVDSVRMAQCGGHRNGMFRVLDNDGKELLTYYSKNPDSSRFMERLARFNVENAVPSRADILGRISLLTMQESERAMADLGHKTRRMVHEESFWHAVAYHAYRELGSSPSGLEPAIEENSGTFFLKCMGSDGELIFRLAVPRTAVKRILVNFKEEISNQHRIPIQPIPLKSLFKINQTTKLDLEVRHLVKIIQQNGEDIFLEGEDLKRYRYGNLVYVRELGVMAELEQPGSTRKFRAPVNMTLKKSQVPAFLEEIDQGIHGDVAIVDPTDNRLRIRKKADRVEISPDAIERDWCWLSVTYGFGNASVSLAEILRARKEGQRFLPCQEGWIDCESENIWSPGFSGESPEDRGTPRGKESVRLSLMDLFRMQAGIDGPIRVLGSSDQATRLNRTLTLKPTGPLPALKGMSSSLRSYQKRGVEWLAFLVENGFGGLLCDDMGLGKTHEVMALMLFLLENGHTKSPFLVVCPTTVLSHWATKIAEHAPGLRFTVYHGLDRKLPEALEDAHVLLTSYGILMRDIEALKTIPFFMAVFDEIQHIKNPETLTHRSARQLNARIKLGLTGTPIENHLGELKALMDLSVPGYLGKDSEFETRYSVPIQTHGDHEKEDELRKLISPFVLRRLKKSVLAELPPKIEDIRTCRLSDDQVRLYREVISSKGKPILNTLHNAEGALPYIHIFAVLNLLKQVCNHPAMLEEDMDDFDKFQSGKWELFKEILSESLQSGHKVVVYSQFLKTISLMERHLTGQGIGYTVLTGSSRKRGSIIRRFNTDPDCRVFLGSLKAGGTGIDLVGGSVVIHYDRWWNAAREDQATDRVHRIGQVRGVQVFKLVTEGTLEEKISAIIEKKRNLMDNIIKEDDANILKVFSREELIELLSPPAGEHLQTISATG